MSATAGSGSEAKEIALAGDRASTHEGQSSFKESAWEIFRASIKQRRQRFLSWSSSSPSATKCSESQETSSENNAHDGPIYGPRPDDEEESKFGESLLGLMQRNGRYNYCDLDDDDQTQQENKGSVRRLIAVRLDLNTVNRTWRNLTNQTSHIIRKALGSSVRR